METFEQMVRNLHTKMPMATQEDAIAFATRIRDELCKGREPVAVVDENDEGENFDTLARISKEELAASQAREQQLREALAQALIHVPMYASTTEAMGRKALALPQDDTALKRYGAKLLRDAAEKFEHDCECGVSCDCYSPVTAKFQLRHMADELEGKK